MPPESCPAHTDLVDSLKSMDGKLDTIIGRLGAGDVRLALNEAKISDISRVVWGGAGVIGLAILGAVLKLVLVNHG